MVSNINSGPLAGIRVVELAGLGPASFTCMLLADMGATVTRVDRATAADFGAPVDPRYQLLNRGRRSIAVDLKSDEGVGIVKGLVRNADALVEGFRPGATERMGLGPDICLEINPRLVYGRMTGWGQHGPLAHAAGHELNFTALTGAIDSIGSRGGPPVLPLNLIGDFGGGALYLAFGIACALLETRSSGQGQVIDGAIVDGAAHLMTGVFGMMARNDWSRERGDNLLSGGRPWYAVYETRDHRYITLGAVEKRFYRELLIKTGLLRDEFLDRDDRSMWPRLAQALGDVIRTRTQDEWSQLLQGTDVCFAPVLSVDEAPEHPHMKARQVFVESHGVVQPAPAPRFGRSKPALTLPPPLPGQHSRELLHELGYAPAQIEDLFARGVVI